MFKFMIPIFSFLTSVSCKADTLANAHTHIAIGSYQEPPQGITMDNENLTAAQKVLSTAELVGEILLWLSRSRSPQRDPANPRNRRTLTLLTPTSSLARCARVNSLWFSEAIRHLWSMPGDLPESKTCCSLPQLLASLPQARRQFYANLITHANLIDVQKSTVRSHNRVLRNLHFPKLKGLTLILDPARPLLLLPNMHVPALKTFRMRLATVTQTAVPAKFDIEFELWARYQHLAGVGLGSMISPRLMRKRRLSVHLARMVTRQLQVSC